jgi:hypothetical protein
MRHGFTDRHRRVLELVCEGKTQKEISVEMDFPLRRIQRYLWDLKVYLTIPHSWHTNAWRARKTEILANFEISIKFQRREADLISKLHEEMRAELTYLGDIDE